MMQRMFTDPETLKHQWALSQRISVSVLAFTYQRVQCTLRKHTENIYRKIVREGECERLVPLEVGRGKEWMHRKAVRVYSTKTFVRHRDAKKNT